MSKKAAEHHKKASEHLTHARSPPAAKHHEAGSREKAAHHAHAARGHAIHGRGHAEEAVKACQAGGPRGVGVVAEPATRECEVRCLTADTRAWEFDLSLFNVAEADMGLVDILNGMQNGPRGQRTSGTASGGMSPMTMALLGLIAYKAIKSFAGNQPSVASPGSGAPSNTTEAGGGLGGLLKGGLGGLLTGGAAGNVLSGGLNDLLKQFQQNGQGEVAHSWIGPGPNKAVSPNDLAIALGADRINTLTALSGMSRDELLNGLSQQLPEVVDQLTPDGRLPTEQEAARLV
jgi:uncharacterized protein YidB (DUF937 family)